MMTLFLQVIWWIWILAAHHVWPPHRMLCHFLYRPPCSRDEVGADAAARARRWFWGENLLQGECDVEYERAGTAEHDLPPCEARGWVWGSQASMDKLLVAGYLQGFYAWRWRGVWATYILDQPVQWNENIERFISKTKPTAEKTFFHVRPGIESEDHKHPSVDKKLDEAALWRMGGVFRQPRPPIKHLTPVSQSSVNIKWNQVKASVMLTVGLTLLSNEHQSHNQTSKRNLIGSLLKVKRYSC